MTSSPSPFGSGYAAEVDGRRDAGLGIDAEERAGGRLDHEERLVVGRLRDAVGVEPGHLHPVARQREDLEVAGLGERAAGAERELVELRALSCP